VVVVPEPEISIENDSPTIETTGDATVAVPSQPPAELPAVETSTESANGSLTIDVRVLSPELEIPDTAQDGASEAISDEPAPDITSGTAASDAKGSEDADRSRANVNVSVRVLSPGEAGPVEQISQETEDEASGAVNTNVSVRVLSPGDDGVVTQIAGSQEPSAASPGTAGDTTDRDSTRPPDSSQYHNEDSADKSESESREERWVWLWILTSDCSEIVSSTSDQNGNPESLDWSWQWEWIWQCDGAPDDTDARSGTQAAPSTDVGHSSASPTGATTGEPPAPEAGTWAWTWTFAVCGDELTFSSAGPSDTPLTWVWGWTWSQTCPAAGDSGVGIDAGGGDTTPQPQPMPAVAGNAVAPGPSIPVVVEVHVQPTELLLVEVTMWPRGLIDLSGTVGTQLDPGLLALVLPALGDVATLPAIISIPLRGATSAPGSSGAVAVPSWSEWGKHGAARPRASALSARPEPAATVRSAPRAPRSAPHARPAARPKDTTSPDRERPFPFLILGGALQLTGTTAGGTGASALLPTGLAAVTGLFVLAPPRLRRRVRPAPELGPRDRYPSPIDHPG